MCGRYYVDDWTEKEVRRLAEGIDEGFSVGSGDVHPQEQACVLYGQGRLLRAGRMRWGFPSVRSDQLLINARAESALQKPMFSESVLKRRCVIPAAGFDEWDHDRNKVRFIREGEPCLFLAGFYNLFDAEQRCIILTTQANESMQPVHDRMPLILPEDRIRRWIADPGYAIGCLEGGSMQLSAVRSYEQLSLPLE